MIWAVSKDLCLVYAPAAFPIGRAGEEVYVLLHTHPKMKRLGFVTWLKAAKKLKEYEKITQNVHFTSEEFLDPSAMEAALCLQDFALQLGKSQASLRDYVTTLYVEHYQTALSLRTYSIPANAIIKRAIADEIDVCFHSTMVREHLGGKSYEECVEFVRRFAGPKCSILRNVQKQKLAGYDSRTISERLHSLLLSRKREQEAAAIKEMDDELPLDEINAMEESPLIHTRHVSDMIDAVWSFPNLARPNNLPSIGFYVFPCFDKEVTNKFGKSIFSALVDYCTGNGSVPERTHLKLPDPTEWYDTAPILLSSDAEPRQYMICDPQHMHERWEAETAEGRQTCWHEVFLPGRSITNIPMDIDIASFEPHWEDDKLYGAVLDSLLCCVVKMLELNFEVKVNEGEVGAFYFFQRQCAPEKQKVSMRILWQLPLQLCAMDISISLVEKMMAEVALHATEHKMEGLTQYCLVDHKGRRYYTDVLSDEWCYPDLNLEDCPLWLQGKRGGDKYPYDPKCHLSLNLKRAAHVLDEMAVHCCLDVQPYGARKSLRMPLCDKPKEGRFEYKRTYNQNMVDGTEFWSNPSQSPVACLSCVPVDSRRSFLSSLSSGMVEQYFQSIRGAQKPAAHRMPALDTAVINKVIGRLAAFYKVPQVYFSASNENTIYPRSADYVICPLHGRKHKTKALRFAVKNVDTLLVLCWKPAVRKFLYLRWSDHFGAYSYYTP
ncbi:ORF121 [Ranid herpesvirus 2]|uniref:ORF121 n=1 Tax=Ranid herpesvirus 2 TaxID=389214 RepID=Q14VY5_9VIRU|nr:ORF121 [Ranid herpesvirus 2]ABG25591.1 ORF121 [Ranid herpesvirus 2]